ncbi:MAG TPA: hypothetical protein VF616_31940 [Duganella sp.]|uniref:MBL fold metallo-hydrolase n=1 Tax=Duganella sp. TaxID=1904440 RepID=UPI002ED0CFD4
MNKKINYLKSRPVVAALMAASLLGACGGGGGQDLSGDAMPESVRMTWFGITNWHYQIGDLGVMLDGEVSFPASTPNPATVSRAYAALKTHGTVDVMLVGHVHPDHSVSMPEWLKQTGKHAYAPQAVCDAAVKYGVPAAQCTAINGGEKFELSPYVTMRVVRWVHSVGCGVFDTGTDGANGGGPSSYGFLFTARTKAKQLTWFVHDSGAGGAELLTDRIANGRNFGAPLSNLAAAMKDAKIDNFELWVPGPESRTVQQARVIVPAFGVKYFIPHHIAERPSSTGPFNLLTGPQYLYSKADFPKLTAFLASNNVAEFIPVNYMDAWSYDATGVKVLDNADAKALLGLPASGPGPMALGPNPRLGTGTLECAED